jgi:carbonic anhydrase
MTLRSIKSTKSVLNFCLMFGLTLACPLHSLAASVCTPSAERLSLMSAVPTPLPAVEFDYKPSPFGVIDTGRHLQVNFERGSAMALKGHAYELKRMEFHQTQASMAVHLIHKDEQGRVATVVVGLRPGSQQPLVQAVWKHWPLERRTEVAVGEGIDP